MFAHGPQGKSTTAWSQVPMNGISSGMIPSSIDFSALPTRSDVWARQPGPSPLQQWSSQRNAHNTSAAGAGLAVGKQVRLCNLTAKEISHYNGLIGDITNVHTVSGPNGTSELLFDIRCPMELPSRNRSFHPDPCHPPIPASSENISRQNRIQMAPLYGISAEEAFQENDWRLPPFLLLTRLPTEKFEALEAKSLPRARAIPAAAPFNESMLLHGSNGACHMNSPHHGNMF